MLMKQKRERIIKYALLLLDEDLLPSQVAERLMEEAELPSPTVAHYLAGEALKRREKMKCNSK